MRQLEQFDFRLHPDRRSQFDPLLDGKIWELGLGDFPSYKNLPSLRSSIYAVAKGRGLKIRTSVVDDRMMLQAYPDNELHGLKAASRISKEEEEV